MGLTAFGIGAITPFLTRTPGAKTLGRLVGYGATLACLHGLAQLVLGTLEDWMETTDLIIGGSAIAIGVVLYALHLWQETVWRRQADRDELARTPGE
ncbi:MAG: hypothetical protein KY446_01470 [Proteobacteria bacterium]|nr:hypothetical protein [Pseudomonadota bacterium]